MRRDTSYKFSPSQCRIGQPCSTKLSKGKTIRDLELGTLRVCSFLSSKNKRRGVTLPILEDIDPLSQDIIQNFIVIEAFK